MFKLHFSIYYILINYFALFLPPLRFAANHYLLK